MNLQAINVSKSYGSKTILSAVNVTINRGEITCIIGPSGAGKTSLLRILAGLEMPDAGEVILEGQSIYKDGLPEGIWPRLTAVFQSLFLWPHMTLRENILLPARMINEKAEKDLEGLCKILEMGDFIDRYPNESSGGQKQRVALARALILNPKFILLDEITSALDIEQSAKILTKLTHLKERNIGTFIITHHLGFAKRTADNIVFMDNGRVLEQGTKDILDAPKTERFKSFLESF